MTDGEVDQTKLRLFVFTRPPKMYWALGEDVGKAWSIGKDSPK